MLDEHLATALHLQLESKSPGADTDRLSHDFFQTSTLAALFGGKFDGDVSYGELKKHGNFGLGTFNALDGEMIAVDGNFYKGRYDGTVVGVENAELTPFAVVTFFQKDREKELNGQVTMTDIEHQFDSLAPDHEGCYAVRADGTFTCLKLRSVPKQTKPYPSLGEVTKQQSIFEVNEINGTVVGFRFPKLAQGLNLPGYHLHFISEDRTVGGHIFDCSANKLTLTVDHSSSLHLELPPGVNLEESSAQVQHGIERAESGPS